jgi:hypothetical protein
MKPEGVLKGILINIEQSILIPTFLFLAKEFFFIIIGK